jgi:mono/diheme cytochrome c family protein
MLRRLVILLVAIALVAAPVSWVVTNPSTIAASALPAHTPNVANGKTIFYAGGCASCHATPGQGDLTKLGGGLGLKSPFGTFYVPNISPDANDGVGRWTEAEFATALLKGTSPRGTHYFPSFPYASYQRMTLEDTRDLFAFMKTLPAVQGRVRDHDVPFPYNIRRALGGWKFLYADGRPFQPDPSRSEQWNRGAYLVNALGHCAECHSPRNALGGIVATHRFAGGPDPEGDGFVPNITQKGLGDWSEKDFADFLESGQTPSFDSVSGAMGLVIKNTSQLPAADRAAMAAYLKSLPAVDSLPRPGKS